MYFSKTREVISPSRGTDIAAGIDFFIPVDFGSRTLLPNESVRIPSGIHCSVPKGFMLLALNKSGVAVNKNLIVGAQVVDEDYQGEIHLHVINVGMQSTTIRANEKLVQFILIPVNYAKPVEIEIEKLYSETTARGTGGFGSTDIIREGSIVSSTKESQYDFTGLPVITVDGTDALVKIPSINESRWIPFDQLIKLN